jgi:VWFA-related protein
MNPRSRARTRHIRASGNLAGAAVLIGAFLTGSTDAQVPAPTQAQAPRFKSGVEVVLLDVNVVDRKGTPDEGFGPGDFTVTVDGIPRTVVSAQFIRHTGMPQVTEPRPDPGEGAGAPPPPPPPVRPRDVLIVVDEDSLETADALPAKRAITTFIDQLATTDRIGIVTIPRLRANITLSSDRVEVRRAIAAIVPGAFQEQQGTYWIGMAEAFEIARMDQITLQKVAERECTKNRQGVVNPSCARELVTEARQMAARGHLRGQIALDALRTLATGLKQIDGPKTVVLVSGGILPPESTSAYTALHEPLAAAQASLYTLFFEKTPYSGNRAGKSPTILDDDQLEAEGLENVTSAAGGTLLRVIGQVEPYFTRVATELSASYLLGIEVQASDRDGKTHRVEVKVNRPGLEVRARKQYVIQAEKKPSRPPSPSSGETVPLARSAS